MDNNEFDTIPPEGENGGTAENTAYASAPQDPHTQEQRQSPFADGPYTTGYQSTNSYQPGYIPPVPPRQPKQKKSGGKVFKTILSAVLILALVVGSCGITASLVNSRWEERTDQMTTDFNQQIDTLQKKIDKASQTAGVPGGTVSGSAISSEGLTPGQIYAMNVDSVVFVKNEASDAYGQSISYGSGFILSEDGYVVSNYHVVSDSDKLTVTTADGTAYSAELVGFVAKNDVSLLKIDAQGLPAVTIGSSDALSIGDAVVAIGNPLGTLALSQSVGYVSGKDRDVATDGTTINMLQIDAAINSGNSGGPLFNMKGEVVGITTAKYSGTTSSGASIEGIGFAIPIDDVIDMITDLRDYGYVTGAYLGVMVRAVDSDAHETYNLPLGAYVEEVTPGYCAEKAGVQEKDIITALGGTRVESVTDLTRALRKLKAGDETTLTVYRGGKELTLKVVLSEKPHDEAEQQVTIPQEDANMPQGSDPQEWFNYFAPFFGFGNQNAG